MPASMGSNDREPPVVFLGGAVGEPKFFSQGLRRGWALIVGAAIACEAHRCRSSSARQLRSLAASSAKLSSRGKASFSATEGRAKARSVKPRSINFWQGSTLGRGPKTVFSRASKLRPSRSHAARKSAMPGIELAHDSDGHPPVAPFQDPIPGEAGLRAHQDLRASRLNGFGP